MPMRFKGKLRRTKKDEKLVDEQQQQQQPSAQTESTEQKRLYVQCEAMVNEQYSQDKSMGKIVYINDDEHPILIDNDHFAGRAVFRVRDFDGWTPIDPQTGHPRPLITHNKYFDGHRRAFSIQIQGRFKKAWSGDDVMFGTWFDRPLILPRFYKPALLFAQSIDRSMTYELNTDKPYLCSPLICAMNVINVQSATTLPQKAINGKLIADNSQHDASKHGDDDDGGLPKWTWYDGKRLEENLLSEWATWPTPPDSLEAGCSPPTDDSQDAKHRRAWFLSTPRRHAFTFHPEVVYSFDFFSPYVDVNRMQLKLVFNIDVSYYLDGQPLRYQARNRDGSVVFFEFIVGMK